MSATPGSTLQITKMQASTSMMPRSIVELPPDIDGDYEVYLNGVLQQPIVDFDVEERVLMFNRPLRKDHVSGWRWFLGAWGVGTYRQDDAVDIRYEVDGQPRVAHRLKITLVPMR